MRAVLHQDLTALAKCLIPLDDRDRRAYADLQIKLATSADRYRKKFGKSHPMYGNGTLASCCVGGGKDEPRIDDNAYAECLIHSLEAILAFRRKTMC